MSEPRELLCMKCGVEHPVWYADNDLWNAAVRRAAGSDEWPFLCPTCFMRICAERGVGDYFRVSRGAGRPDAVTAAIAAWEEMCDADFRAAGYGRWPRTQAEAGEWALKYGHDLFEHLTGRSLLPRTLPDAVELEAHPSVDAEGHCTRCGLAVEDYEECPPGFVVEIRPASRGHT